MQLRVAAPSNRDHIATRCHRLETALVQVGGGYVRRSQGTCQGSAHAQSWRQATPAAGMSTRAIAPVVGVSQPQVVADKKAAGDQPLITSPAPTETPAPLPTSETITGSPSPRGSIRHRVRHRETGRIAQRIPRQLNGS